MTRQYQCEYCHRSFRDTAEDRRKHWQSAFHQNAKFEHEIDCLRTQTNAIAPILHQILTDDERRTLNEILTKPTVCKFANQCRYGDRCRDSHRLTELQIKEYKDRFTELLFSNRVKELVRIRSSNLVSKRQLKKELSANLWLERRFNADVQSDFTKQLLANYDSFREQHCNVMC